MGHLPKLIEDPALILIAGALVTLLFRRIKQPRVFGYIIAGFLVGPYFHLYLPLPTTRTLNFKRSALRLIRYTLYLIFI